MPASVHKAGQFQFPPLREGRPADVLHTAGPMLFQFPPLREGRLVRISMETYASGISIPAPARGATGAVVADQDLLFHFNSRPCARGDVGHLDFAGIIPISIPAPARGATLELECGAYECYISIPAPARGATGK